MGVPDVGREACARSTARSSRQLHVVHRLMILFLATRPDCVCCAIYCSAVIMCDKKYSPTVNISSLTLQNNSLYDLLRRPRNVGLSSTFPLPPPPSRTVKVINEPVETMRLSCQSR